tara:strand:- start:1575 stop:2108 length:534 start_codon:yes stop_codon:yes gene_type:complete
MDYIIDLNVMKVEIQDLKNIQKNEVTLVKNFISLTREYDFNLLSTLMEENECVITQKSNIGNLKDIFEMRSVSDSLNEFKIFYDFLSKLFKYERDSKDEINLFFSFVSQVGGSHADKEDVFIIGLQGKVIYRVFDVETKDYSIEKGDMIFIPKGIKHKVIGLNPRIVASIGFFGKRK